MNTKNLINTKIKFFGAAQELVAVAEIDFSFAENIKAKEAFAEILTKLPVLREKFGNSLLFAVNQEYAKGNETIKNGDELAVFPPVSGG